MKDVSSPQLPFGCWKAVICFPHPKPFLLKAKQAQIIQLWSSLDPNLADTLWTISRLLASLSNCGEENWTVCSRCGLTGAEQSRKITSLHLPAIVLLIQPGMLLAFVAARVCSWLVFGLLSAKTPCAFSVEQLSSSQCPAGVTAWDYSIQVQDLTSVSAETLVKPHSCWPNLNSLLRSFYMVSFSLSPSNSSPSLGSFLTLVRVRSVLPSRSFVKLTCIDSRGTLFMTSCQHNLEPLTTTLWAQQFSQFFNHFKFHLFSPYLNDLSKWILRESVSNTLLKSR